MALFNPLMGSIIDRKGVRWPFIFSLIGYGLAGGAGLLINSYWVLLVSRACLGIALAGVFAAINVLILSNYQGGDRDKVMGWRGSAQSFGGVLWPLIGGALGGFSWHFPFAIYMLAIPIGLLAMRVVSEPVTHHLTGPSSGNDTTVFTLLKQNPILLLIIYGLMFFCQCTTLCYCHLSAPTAGNLRYLKHISDRYVSHSHDGFCRGDRLHLRKDTIPIFISNDRSDRCCNLVSGVYYHIPGLRYPYHRGVDCPVRRQPGTYPADDNGVDRRRYSVVFSGKIQRLSGNFRFYRPVPITPSFRPDIDYGGS